jgi:hypothetical protein
MNKSCGTCQRSFAREDNSNRCCGAGMVIDDKQPIWAVRKYSPAGMLKMLAEGIKADGLDCENMRPDDGAECDTYLAE